MRKKLEKFLDLKNWNIKQAGKNLWLPFLLIFAGIFLDQFIKYIVKTNMSLYQSIVLIDNWLEFYYTLNIGAAFGILKGGRVFFIILTLTAMLLLTAFLVLKYKQHILLRISLGLIIAGGIGNLIDRIITGEVVDFVHFIFGGYSLPILGESFAIFNVADILLVVGVILLIYYILFVYVDLSDAKAVAKHNKKLEAKEQKKQEKLERAVVSVEEFLERENGISDTGGGNGDS